MIEAVNLIKHYGKKTAVGNISFTVEPSTVTGFLGPNGAGKSTTMRMIMGLDKPTNDKVTINGHPYRQLSAPLCETSALLDVKDLHGSHSAHSHLHQLAVSNSIPTKRVDEVLDITGLTSVTRRCVKGFPLGMGQRLGIATAPLSDPSVFLFGKPVNSLDSKGVKWIRETCRRLTGGGRAVFISPRLMSKMAQTTGHLLVIGHGRILTAGPVNDVIASTTADRVRVASPRATQLTELMASRNLTAQPVALNVLETTAITTATIDELVTQGDIVLHELTTIRTSLEEAYTILTSDSVEYHTGPASQAQMQQAQVRQTIPQDSARG